MFDTMRNRDDDGLSRREVLRGAIAAGAAAPRLGLGGRQETRPMIQIRRSAERGHADHGWLDTYHTFSFAGYHDPDFVHFGPLRVLNQDRVKPGQGFGTHGHEDMEIVSYVLEGVMEHKDSMGNGSQMRPGDVQLMSAGTGVMHSEFNASAEDGLHFLQMWVFPRERGTEPRYEQKAFTEEERRGGLRLVVSPDGAQGSLTIGQDARLFAGLLDVGERLEHDLGEGRAAWLHVARGSVRLNGTELAPGDGAAIRGEGRLELVGLDPAELVLWELPAEWSAR
jgi:redox-sensitive bicupin YhaK (pirin superfamily)